MGGIAIETDYNDDSQASLRPLKRARLAPCNQEIIGHSFGHDDDDDDAIRCHPLGIKPAGNAFTADVNLKKSAGLLATLTDELWMVILELLPARELLYLGATCKALYAFAHVDELWRSLFIEKCPASFKWLGSWRSTYFSLPLERQSYVDCSGLFSDVLHRPFFCTFTPLDSYATKIPPGNQIPVFHNLSREEYDEQWTHQPFILTEPVKHWPAYKEWTVNTLLKRYAKTKFRAEAVDWNLHDYFEYMNSNNDESPLYLFDRSFVEKMSLSTIKDDEAAVYWAPDCFGEDLFSVLGEQRPDSRWLIVGPKRSGSTFHKDPNATNAWNAVLTGSKYWLMFPSSSNLPPPPGVILSEDHAEITSPLSIAEYLLSFHEIARATPGCKEGICHAGEVLHVPSGWFHLVLNLDASIAITQNFVPQRKLANVIRFLRDSPDQVSGFDDNVADPYGLFVERLKERHTDLLEAALASLSTASKQGRWDALTRAEDNSESENGGFSFGFGADDSEGGDS